MKKYLLYFFVAMAGGFVVLVGTELLHKKPTAQVGVPQTQLPVQFANYTPSTAMELPDFVAAANNSVHAVVHIKTSYVKKNVFYDFFFGTPQTIYQPLEGFGSGVIVSQDGYIVTNNHVVQDAVSIEVVLNDKRTYTAKLIGRDPSTDLAVIKIDEQNLPTIPYGNSDNVQVGEWVLAVGNPFNLTSTVTAGIVSAKARNINILRNPEGGPTIESFIQTDAAVNSGNSGGALVSTKGELIGINAAIASPTMSYAGYSFAIPVNIVKKAIADLIEFGEIQRGFLGISTEEIDSKFADENNIKGLRGLYVSNLAENGSAANVGIRKGDIIVSIDNFPVNSQSELSEHLIQYRPGDKVAVGVLRNGQQKDFEVTLRNSRGTTEVSRRSATAEDQNPSAYGATFKQLTKDQKDQFGLSNGMQVVDLKEGLLKSAGVREGFIITSINKRIIRNESDIIAALNNRQNGVLIQGIYPNSTKPSYYGF